MLIGRQKKILSKILVNYAGININENDYNRKVLKYKVRAVLTSNNDFNITNILKRWIEDRFKDSLTLVDNIPIHYADEYVVALSLGATINIGTILSVIIVGPLANYIYTLLCEWKYI